jgi:SAM-dependent methyltransferase
MTDIDWQAMGTVLEREAEIRTPYLREAIGWLSGLTDRAPSRILDLGSGPGVLACTLAEGFAKAEVIAVDGTPELLERTKARALREGVADRLHTLRADLPDDFGTLGDADLVWMSHVLHHLGDQQAALGDMRKLVRPGGLLAVVEGGLPSRMLPRDIGLGRPGLQARMDAAGEDWFGEMRAALPGSTATVEDWPAMLTRAGLTPLARRTFLIELSPPLGTDAREFLHRSLGHHRERMTGRLDPGDLATLDRLLDRDDPAGIMTRPDAFYLSAATVHVARRDDHR